MGFDQRYVFGGIALGIGATLLMDLWNLFLKRAFGIPSLNYCLLGRWLRHMTSGKFTHASIGGAAQKSYECTVGWIGHYSIGIMFALVFLMITSGAWLVRPSLALAVVYGIATVVFPFFIMQPSLGLGVASSRAAKPGQARLKSLATHTVFGVGLYLSAIGVSYVLQAQ